MGKKSASIGRVGAPSMMAGALKFREEVDDEYIDNEIIYDDIGKVNFVVYIKKYKYRGNLNFKTKIYYVEGRAWNDYAHKKFINERRKYYHFHGPPSPYDNVEYVSFTEEELQHMADGLFMDYAVDMVDKRMKVGAYAEGKK